MNSVLCQELVRYNRLLAIIKGIGDFQLALRGRIVMTGELDALGSAMYDGKIPAMWAKKSYPSLKPLAAYVSGSQAPRHAPELDRRRRAPRFWITGFFFTHAFLTGVLQNYGASESCPSTRWSSTSRPCRTPRTSPRSPGRRVLQRHIHGGVQVGRADHAPAGVRPVLHGGAHVWFVPTSADAGGFHRRVPHLPDRGAAASWRPRGTRATS